MPLTLDLPTVRAAFPSLSGEWAFFDNAGGSQCLEAAATRVRDYLLTTNVQHGASYAPSREAEALVASANAALGEWIGAESPDEVVVGPSATQLMTTFAQSFSRHLREGDEIVVTDLDHEANISPWRRLEHDGLRVRTWRVDDASWQLRLEDLQSVLSDRTRLVCFTAASNLVGAPVPVAEIVDFVHRRGALTCVDAVAWAPHRLPDTRAWGSDLTVFSLYKAYGPHAAVLRAPAALLRELPGQSLDLVPEDAIPRKFQPGNVNYELTWGAAAVVDYLESLAPDAPTRPERIETAYELIAAHEESLSTRLLEFLNARDSVTVWGPTDPGREARVPTISFTVDGRSSRSVVEHLDGRRLGARHGNFHAPRLVERMGLDPEDGVVRISLVHYNTVEEVERLTAALRDVT